MILNQKTILCTIIPLIFGLTTSTAQLISISVGKPLRDDGSSILTKQDSVHLKSFSITNVEKPTEFKSKEEINFELIDSKQLKQIFTQNKYTWVFIQSSWCGACLFSAQKYIKLCDSLKENGISLIIINQDIQLKKLQKKLYLEKYKLQSYIIDPKVYGTVETKKQESFINEITEPKTPSDYNPGSVPKNLFFDQDGNLIYFAPVNNITSSLIKEKVFTKN